MVFPERLLLARHAGTDLLKRVVDVLLAGDLREFRRVGKLLHTELDVKKHETDPGWLYGGLVQPLDDVDSAHVYYESDDFGWGHWVMGGPLGLFPPPQPQARTADLRIAVETDATCLSPDSIARDLHDRKSHYQVNQDDLPSRTYFVRGANLISLTASVKDACIQSLAWHQVTDFRHDVSYPLRFVPGDVRDIFSERLNATGRAKIEALLWRLDRRKPCGIELVVHTGVNVLESDKLRERGLVDLVKIALMNGGFAGERIQIVNEGPLDDGVEGVPTPFVSVQESHRSCSQP